MGALKRENQLSKFTQSLELAGLAGYFEDTQLDATLFAPTDDAILNAAWEDWTADDPRLIGALLYHSVPFKAQLPEMPKELRTNLGPDDVLLLRPGADTGGPDRQPPLAVVAPITDFHSPPAKVLRTIRTCRGVVHIIDTALEPDDSSIEPEALASALAKMLENMRTRTSGAGASASSRLEESRRGADLLGGSNEERGSTLGGSRGGQPSALERMLSVAQEAAAKRVRDEEEAERKKAAEAESRARKEKEQAEMAELSSPGGAAKAVLAAEAAQQKALTAARLAFRAAESTGQTLAAAKAQDWLGAAEYAVEGIASAKEAASWSGAYFGLMDQAHSAARAAMLLAEVSLAQHTAVAMARTGDWASSLLGEPATSVLSTEAGKAWAEAALDAHTLALKAASAAGSLASSIAAKASAQDVLGSKSGKQPPEANTLDTIKSLVQKLPLAERTSLNSLLNAQLKGGAAGGGGADTRASKVKRVLKPDGSWPAAGQSRLKAQQDDESQEEKEQLQQDIAELSGESTGSSFDVQPKRPKKAAAKLKLIAGSQAEQTPNNPSRLSIGATVTKQKPAAIEESEETYLEEVELLEDADEPVDPDSDTWDAVSSQQDTSNAHENWEEPNEDQEDSDAFVKEAVASKLRSRSKAVASESQSGPLAAEEAETFMAETETFDMEQGGDGSSVTENLDDYSQLTGQQEGENMDTADRLLARRRAEKQSAQSAKPAAGDGSRAGRANAKSGRKDGAGAARAGAREIPGVAESLSAGEGDLWADQNSREPGAAAAAAGESAALVNTWDEKHKAAEQ